MKKVNNSPIVIYVGDNMVMSQEQEIDLIKTLINQIKFAIWSKEPFIIVGVLVYRNYKQGGFIPTFINLIHTEFIPKLNIVIPTLEEHEEYELCAEIMKLIPIISKTTFKDIPKPGEDLSSVIHQL
jgi:hypothetical protein